MAPYLTLLKWRRQDPTGAQICAKLTAHVSLGWRLFTSGVTIRPSGIVGAFAPMHLIDHAAICTALETDLALYAPGSRDYRTVDSLLMAARADLADRQG